MVTCEICGRQFKNTQGLRGHKTFMHGNGSPSSISVTPAAAEEQLSKLEDRLEKLEYITGLREVSILDRQLNTEKPLTEKLNDVTEQLNSLTQQLASLSGNTASNSDLRRINEQISRLAQQLSSYSRWFEPVRTLTGTMSRLENELIDRTRNTRVNTLENRLALLEERQKKTEEKTVMSIQECKVVTDTQLSKVMEVINHVVDKLATSLKQLQSQLREQKQVTDWVKKEYNLRTVQKVS